MDWRVLSSCRRTVIDRGPRLLLQTADFNLSNSQLLSDFRQGNPSILTCKRLIFRVDRCSSQKIMRLPVSDQSANSRRSRMT
jgi:hypothetical protein